MAGGDPRFGIRATYMSMSYHTNQWYIVISLYNTPLIYKGYMSTYLSRGWAQNPRSTTQTRVQTRPTRGNSGLGEFVVPLVHAADRCQRRRQLVGLDEHLAGLRTLAGPDDSARFPQIPQSTCLGEPDSQLALH